MASETTASSRLMDVVRRREQLDTFTQLLLPSASRLFGGVSLPLPDVDGGPELAFLRTASWLYVHYFEAGRVGVRFLVRRNVTASPPGHGDEHLNVVNALRTWTQHNIDFLSAHDARLTEVTTAWFEKGCGTRLPRTDSHWALLLQTLLVEAQAFLDRLLDLVTSIERDDDCAVICEQWEARLKRDWPAHRFHELISVVAADIGRAALDPVAFHNRHGGSYRDALRLLSEDCDIDVEARKLVERTLLAESDDVLPITGLEVMASFGIPPGPDVGRLLEVGRRLYREQPCTADVLLQRMADTRTGAG